MAVKKKKHDAITMDNLANGFHFTIDTLNSVDWSVKDFHTLVKNLFDRLMDVCKVNILEDLKVTDGYLVPLGEDKWIRLIGCVDNFVGVAVYDNGDSCRIMVDKVNHRICKQEISVYMVRGSDTILNRLNSGFVYGYAV